MYIARLTCADGQIREAALACEELPDGFRVTLPREQVGPDVEWVDFLPGFAWAMAGEEGYFALPRGQKAPCDMLCAFEKREDQVYESGYTVMPWFGVKTPRGCFIALFTGLWSEHAHVVTVRDGRYEVQGRFTLEGQGAGEDMAMEFHFLRGEEADYSGMCRFYREFQRRMGRYLTLKERGRSAVEYAASAPEIRVRLAWKPVPTPVEEQTPETEPPLHVAATFDRVGEIMEAMKRSGVEKAEFCLVGWNKSGHDGRYPQLFPVEEKLGGEEGLRRLVEKAGQLGYKLVCHTNSTDCYSIASDWDPEVLPIRGRDGSPSKGAQWGGGRMYNMCPHAALPLARRDLPRVAALGFSGLHYIDVVGVVAPRKCFSPRHPATRMDFVETMRQIMRKSTDLFGGFQSEGVFDCYSRELDYGLYAAFGMLTERHPLCSRRAPLWQLVYHGSILSNPTTETVNYPIKGWEAELAMMEYGGRPSLYLYSRFVTPTEGRGNWMGSDDLTCDDSENLSRTARVAGQVYRDYAPLARLQWIPFRRHDELAPGVTQTTYEDGTRVLCNYGEGAYRGKDVEVPPHEWRLLEG